MKLKKPLAILTLYFIFSDILPQHATQCATMLSLKTQSNCFESIKMTGYFLNHFFDVKTIAQKV